MRGRQCQRLLIPIIVILSSSFASVSESSIKCDDLTSTATCRCSRPRGSLSTFDIQCSEHVQSNEPEISIVYEHRRKLEIKCIREWHDYAFDDDADFPFPLEPSSSSSSPLAEPINPIDFLAGVNIQPANELLLQYCNITSPHNFSLQRLIAQARPEHLSLKHIIFKDGILEQLLLDEDDDDDDDDAILSKIQQFNLDSSNLRELPATALLRRMKNLINLSVNYNQLQSIRRESFTANSNLHNLELGSNNISDIHPDAFRGLEQLDTLHLWSNNIQELHPNIFDHLGNLQSLELMNNKLTHLAAHQFAQLNALRSINLESNQFRTFPEYLFAHNWNLTSIRLARNRKLSRLPAQLFANATVVENITLQQNNLTQLADSTFAGLRKLKSLNLANNHLTYINNRLLSETSNLVTLDLHRNDIAAIDEQAFDGVGKLESLDLSYNRLETVEQYVFLKLEHLTHVNLAHNRIKIHEFAGTSPMNHLIALVDLDLSHNEMEFIPEDFLLTKTSMAKLDMQYNQLQRLDFLTLNAFSSSDVEIDVSNNEITVVDNMDIVEKITEQEANATQDYYSTKRNVKLIMTNNPLACDFNNYDLFRYFHLKMNPTFRVVYEIKADVKCASPKRYSGLRVDDVKPSSILQPIANCSDVCDCFKSLYYNTFIIDCSNRNLTMVPAFNLLENDNFLNVNGTQLILRHNRIDTLPDGSFGRLNLTYLDVSFNNLSAITWLPEGLKALMLDHNYLKRINHTILQDLRNLTLDHNPWICDCDTVPFWIYLSDNQIDNKIDIRCDDNNKSIRLLSRENLCPSYTKVIIIVVVIGALLFIIPSIGVAVFYKYRQEIKVWLFARNMCLWFVREEDLDRDKIYDAFISFSQQDEHFIIDELMAKLENGPHPYKLCIHMRNWIPGEFIAKQVAESVLNSRRTIVVLSPSFLESVWGKMEFRAAHTKAISEGVARVIVILYNDLDPQDERIDEELRVYLKTNTYIKWGDPWFWDKLKYALPHRKCGNNSGYVNKRFESISDNLDKMDKLNQNVNVNLKGLSASPPIDPLLLKANKNGLV